MLKGLLGATLLVALPLTSFADSYTVVERPRQECWNEQVATGSRGNDYTGAVIGGVAGGILGNQVGGGNGKTVATAVGAATGAVVGDRMSNSGPSYQTVQRCRTVVERQRVPVAERVVVQPVPVQRVVVQPVPVERVVVRERVIVEEHDHGKHKGHYKHKHKHGHDHDDD